MSVYSRISRASSVGSSVNEIANAASSANAVLTGTTTINGSTIMHGPIALGSTIAGVDVADGAGLETPLISWLRATTTQLSQAL